MAAVTAVTRDDPTPPCPVRRLGVFGPTRYSCSFEMARSALVPLIGALDAELRPLVTRYLLSGTTVLTHLGYTADVLEYRFGVNGGSAVLTDGAYYWRRDAAEYVRIYGIGLDPEAISHMQELDWLAPPLDDGTVTAVDSFLKRELSLNRY